MLVKDQLYFEALCKSLTLEKNQQLQVLIEQVSLRCFQKPFSHHGFYNQRLRTTGGRYHLNDHHIDINPKVLSCYGWTELVDVIIHELCHYHLHLEDKGYQHKDQDFKQLLKLTGGSRYVKPLVEKNERTSFIYQCQKCAKEFPRKRRVNLAKYGCPCGGKLKLKTAQS